MIGSLAIMVLAMIFSFGSISQITWDPCLLQVTDPILFHLRELTPLVSRRYCGIAPPAMNSSWCDTSRRFLPIHRFWVVVNREHGIPFARHPFSRCRRY